MLKRIYEISRYVLAPTNTFEYIACLGINNLGDEILFDALKKNFLGANFIPTFHPLNRFFLKEFINHPKRLGVVLGGGTLLRTEWEIENFKMHVERLGTGIIFGTGLGSPSFITEQNIVHLLEQHCDFFNSLDFIGVRGPESHQTFTKAGIKSEVIGDLACSFVQPIEFWQPSLSKKIGINIGLSNGLVWGSEEQIFKSYVNLVKMLLKNDWEVEFYVVWQEDLAITKKLALEVGVSQEKIILCTHDLHFYLNKVKSLHAFIGIKLHSVVLAMCANVPSIMIEYRPKCRDFMDSVDLGEFCVKSNNIEEKMLLNILEKICTDGASISKKIHSRFSFYSELQKTKAKEVLGNLKQKMESRK